MMIASALSEVLLIIFSTGIMAQDHDPGRNYICLYNKKTGEIEPSYTEIFFEYLCAEET